MRDPEDPESIRSREKLVRRLGRSDVREKLRHAICRFPSEWDRNTIAQRHSWLKVDDAYRVDEGLEWDQFKAHAEAISFADLPEEYLQAIWHVHPRMFIGHMRECAWLTVDYLKRIFSAADGNWLKDVVSDLNRFSAKYLVNTRLRQAHFFSQIFGETGPSMRPVTENWQYSPAALKGFSRYYREHPLEAEQDGYLKNEKGAIIRNANQTFIGRKHFGAKNGNRADHPNDGSDFRGRGLLQITGYEKYAGFRKSYSSLWQGPAPNSVEEPEAINTYPYSIRSAVWFWGIYKKELSSVADKGSKEENLKKITELINGGYTGLPDRQRGLNLAEKVFL